MRDRGLFRGTCLSGQLTRRGVEQMQALGNAVKDMYRGLIDAENITLYGRSTDYQRTKESASGFVSGIAPTASVVELNLIETVRETMASFWDICQANVKYDAALNQTDWYRAFEKETLAPLKEQFLKETNASDFSYCSILSF